MMDTTTRKQEALYILKVIERGSADREFIGEARRKFYDLMNAQGCERRDYLDSVDACLTLPLRGGYFWKLQSAVSGIPESQHQAMIYNIHAPRELLMPMEHIRMFKTLPLAMLWAFWHMQP
jgi:hypothetical protein